MIAADDRTPRLEIKLEGPAAEGGRLRLDVLVEAAHAVQSAVTRLAYALRGEASVRPGRPARDIADVTRLELIGLREGSAVLTFDLAGHERPLDELDLGAQALRAFETGVAAISVGAEPPEPWNDGVDRAVSQLTRTLDRGIDRILVGRTGAPPDRVAALTRATKGRRALVSRPGAREYVEVEGRLLMADFAATRHEARIHRALDPPIRCTFGDDLESTVVRLLRRYVHAKGWADLDDQGRMKSLELESLEDAELTDGRPFWDLATLDEMAVDQGIKPVERLEDLVSGFWPEDESVDEFLAAIGPRG